MSYLDTALKVKKPRPEAGKVVPIRPEQMGEPGLDRYPSLSSLSLSQVAALDPQGEAVRQVGPDAWKEILAAEDAFNELWKQAQGGRQVWAEYQAAVRNWQKLFTQAINEEKRLSKMAQNGRSVGGKG